MTPRILTAAELRSLQRILLDMLLEVDRICKKYGIKYHIDGGTFLGAVRHKGFIPWDDDLDIVMLRCEYEMLREACKSELDPQKYFFQDHTTDPHYRWGYGRIRRVGSEFVREGQEHLKMQSGIFLDIFPRDNAPKSRILQAFFSVYCWFWRKVLYSEVGKIHAPYKSIRLAYRIMNKISKETVFSRLGLLARKMNAKETGFVRCYTFQVITPQRCKFAYPKKWFIDTKFYEFEGHKFPGSKYWNEYLTFDYGEDYMTLPPEEKRRQHPCTKFKLPDDAE